MKSYLKKTLFVFAGLLFIGGGFFFGQPGKVDAASKEEKKKFGNWSLNCSVDDKKKQICFLSQQINNTIKGKEQEVLALYQVGNFGQEKEVKIVETLPANILIAPGTSIISGTQLIAPGKYVNCTLGNCQAVASISQSDLKTILSSDNNFVGVMTAEGKQVNFPLSKEGLEEGLKALKIKIN
ncbi:invasion associated locus B family protein [Rickettsia endosymbiont of Polydrusus tereticollis]|uniref:invasion associated locus B family protein n=1 Tax=Rickettsia endosymbiont of Polydrusus tereticollis TaxID=3066251 RepID=UPI0031330001